MAPGFLLPQLSVGASTLAKVANANAGNLDACGAVGFFASMLAPTGKAKSL
jgi:hypothetical protein